jgi:SP family galactose:H+ symporter-like MFS transporter
MPEVKHHHKRIVYIVALTAAMAGLLFGLDIGVISGALPLLPKKWQLTSGMKEFIVSSLLVGAMVGALCSGALSRKLGRKKTLLISALIFAVGTFYSGISVSPHMLAGVRFFLGLAVGIASFTAPLYLSEMSPPSIRGALIAMYQLMITIGILLAFLSDTVLSYGGHWRIMLGILVVPSALMFIGICMLPESPRWLVLAGFGDKAKEVLEKLRTTPEEVAAELEDIRKSLEIKQNGFQLLSNPNYIKVIFLGIGLQAMQQFTGMNVVMYYAPSIFQSAGFASTTQQMWGTALVGLTNVLATFIAIAFVDKMGRKPILYAGYAVMGLAMISLGFMFHAGVKTGAQQITAVAILLTFIVGFAMSSGPIIWILCSEIYPLSGRDLGITCSTASNWFCNAIVGATFLTMLERLGDASTFWLYGLMNLAFISLLWWFAPETKGVTLEKIEENLMSGKPLRKIGA